MTEMKTMNPLQAEKLNEIKKTQGFKLPENALHIKEDTRFTIIGNRICQQPKGTPTEEISIDMRAYIAALMKRVQSEIAGAGKAKVARIEDFQK